MLKNEESRHILSLKRSLELVVKYQVRCVSKKVGSQPIKDPP